MKMHSSIGFLAMLLMAGGLLLATSSCRKNDSASTGLPGAAAMTVRGMEKNNLGPLPGAIYQSQANSAIRWQPWTKESMERAKAAHRLVFAVIALPQQPGFQSVLAELANDPALVSAIHDHYVPVLIDGDASREVGLLTADLCFEIGQGLQLPLFLWMTPDGNPVAWLPVNETDASSVAESFTQSHTVVSRTWKDDLENPKNYIATAGAAENARRRARISERQNSQVISTQPAEDALRSLRQLASFYDPCSRAFDEAGGLFPAGSLDLLSSAAIHPGVPAEVRAHCLGTTRELMADLLPSAMFDPLDGGLFASRLGKSWSFPLHVRDSVSQTRAAVALLQAYRATGHPRALERALGVIAFAEEAFMTSEGLVSVGLEEETAPAAWLWSVEEIHQALPPEDAAWWVHVTGMKSMGNVPHESDPLRRFFRRNTLSLDKSLAELAIEQGQPPEAFAQRFETARGKLLQARNARLGQPVRDDSPHAGATFRMVSAYAAAFGTTGDATYRDKAVSLLEKAQAAFYKKPRLSLFSASAPLPVGTGRAFLYGLALQSALDVSDITSDEKWLFWAEDLATTAAELFADSGYLRECPEDASLIDLPITDQQMLFGDSTAGLVSFAECRLAARGRPLLDGFSTLATRLPIRVVERPTVSTDLLQATLAREFPVTVITGRGISPDMKLAVERLPLRMIQRRAARSHDDVPEGSVKVVLSKGQSCLISTPEALQQAVSPAPER